MQKEKRIRGAGGFTKVNTERDDSMSREKLDYRDNLASIVKNFPDGEMLSISNVASYFGWSIPTTRKRVPFISGKYISRSSLARYMSVIGINEAPKIIGGNASQQRW